MTIKRILYVLVSLAALNALTGCDTLRFAPSEIQKQQSYLHLRTTEAAALRAKLDEATEPVQALTHAAAQQSQAITAYYGLPKETPPADSLEDLTGPESGALTDQAYQQALQRPNWWDLADDTLEMGMALAGIVGGALGTRLLAALQLARQKSTALREIVQGNELFKQENPTQAAAFKQAQQNQSATTRALVTATKSSS